MANNKLKLGVLISGSGSNLQAIIDAIDTGTLDAEVTVVIANKPDAYGLQRAEAAGIPTYGLDPKHYEDATAFDTAVLYELHRHKADWVVMAGYMRLVTSHILSAYPHRVLNLHPSKLPAYPGAHAIKDAIDAGEKSTGVTVHIANEIFDDGPIIMQRDVKILPDDTLETLTARMHEVEHQLYPEVLQFFAEDRVSLDHSGKHYKVHITPKGSK